MGKKKKIESIAVKWYFKVMSILSIIVANWLVFIPMLNEADTFVMSVAAICIISSIAACIYLSVKFLKGVVK